MDVAVGGRCEGVDEVRKRRVGEAVAGEVGVDAGQEVLLAEPGDELAQGGGALGVGDAVEVEEGRCGVGDGLGVGGDGVGGGALVGVVAPALAGDGEVDPGVGEAGGFGEGLVAHVFGEGLVQPDVVPPLEGDEVAEPHVGHFVGDDHAAGLALGVGDGGAVDEFVAEGDEARVLHGAGVEFGDEGLVVGVEGVGLVELLVEPVVAGAGDVEDFVRVGVEIGGQGTAAVDPEGDAGVFGADRVPGACGDGDEVGGDQRGGRGAPAAVGLLLGDAVGEDAPAVGGGDGEVEDGFEVGLVEGGEDALDVFHEELGVDVALAVGRVGEAVHAFARTGVEHVGLDAQFVRARGEAGQGEAVLDEGFGVEGLSVEGDGAQGVRLDFDEGVPGLACREGDEGAGVEGVVALGEIEFDRVPLDIEEPGTGLRFVARQYGHAPMVPYGTDMAQRTVGVSRTGRSSRGGGSPRR